MDLKTRLQRLEQQLAAFEKLHRSELAEFERRLAVYRQLHRDEVGLLRSELNKLRDDVLAERSPAAQGPDPASDTPS